MDRPQYYRFHQGQKQLPFADSEYETRLKILRQIMHEKGVDACVLTSMHNVSYYSGFLYCSFGRPYAQVVSKTDTVTFSAGIDAAQPWRRCYGDNITYTDWQRHNYWRAILSVTGTGRAHDPSTSRRRPSTPSPAPTSPSSSPHPRSPPSATPTASPVCSRRTASTTSNSSSTACAPT